MFMRMRYFLVMLLGVAAFVVVMYGWTQIWTGFLALMPMWFQYGIGPAVIVYGAGYFTCRWQVLRSFRKEFGSSYARALQEKLRI